MSISYLKKAAKTPETEAGNARKRCGVAGSQCPLPQQHPRQLFELGTAKRRVDVRQSIVVAHLVVQEIPAVGRPCGR